MEPAKQIGVVGLGVKLLQNFTTKLFFFVVGGLKGFHFSELMGEALRFIPLVEVKENGVAGFG